MLCLMMQQTCDEENTTHPCLISMRNERKKPLKLIKIQALHLKKFEKNLSLFLSLVVHCLTLSGVLTHWREGLM